MDKKLKFYYDREGDILHIDTVKPYKEQESDEIEEGIIARFNPQTKEVENIELLFFSTRLLRTNEIEFPFSVEFRHFQNV